MIVEGQTILFRFPQTDQIAGKLRPALVLRELPGPYNDWLICMVSSQLSRRIPDFDEIITPDDMDFSDSGFKIPSLIRISRLAVVDAGIFLGKLGQVDASRVIRIKQKLSSWIQGV